VLMGTLDYMAPEQVRGLVVDHRADIFALGAILYEMLSGCRAFHAGTTADTMSAILKDDPPALPVAERHIPPALDEIVRRCLEKNAADRFYSAHDLAIALETIFNVSSAVAVVPVSPRRRVPAWIAIALAAAVAVAIGAAGAFRLLQPDAGP